MLKIPSFCEQEDCINKKALKVGFLERFLYFLSYFKQRKGLLEISHFVTGPVFKNLLGFLWFLEKWLNINDIFSFH